ncbi:MAG TPA: SOS response-associated peptidase [Chthonomonadaceae bacterium]|nr:SOS response-associated peptidase [Chthonomonadaceae bacterium]
MCGRFTLHHDTSQIALRFDVQRTSVDVPERYNIAPTQPVAVVTVNSSRTLQMMRWGLIPSWAKDPAIGNKLINARAETLPERPAYKSALMRRRCLIPSDGFYEWQAVGKGKQPMYIHRKDDGLFAFAGLWEEWHSPEGETVRSCTIITTAPNDLMAPIHDRMPAILRPEDEAAWLDMSLKEADMALQLLRPYPAAELEAYPVSRLVNAPTNDVSDCIAPASW